MENLLGVWLQWGPHRGPHGPMGPDWGPGHGMESMGSIGGMEFGFGWPVFWLILVAIVVIAIMYLVNIYSSRGDSDRSMAILRDQYVRGNLSDEEFEERSARLAATDPR